MGALRFADLARQFVATAMRRTILGLGAAGLLGALGLEASDAKKHKHKHKNKHKDKDKKKCKKGKKRCGKTCVTGSCCAGAECGENCQCGQTVEGEDFCFDLDFGEFCVLCEFSAGCGGPSRCVLTDACGAPEEPVAICAVPCGTVSGRA